MFYNDACLFIQLEGLVDQGLQDMIKDYKTNKEFQKAMDDMQKEVCLSHGCY